MPQVFRDPSAGVLMRKIDASFMLIEPPAEVHTTRFLNIIFNFCYLESKYSAEIIISTGVPNPLEHKGPSGWLGD